ncbi:MAG TPA: SDR family oxidoreductase [Candidatus Dormibacteraeota bacterium]|nr:SDR family oxidoreductase [Candidatus Dormibacteraeota bacterium]
MILVAGGTGRLGTRVAGLLRERGLGVRVLTRERSRAGRLGAGVEIVEGDVRVPAALMRSVEGVRTVVSAIHGFVGPRGASPATVDRDGNRNLIRAAREAGVEHLVLVSVRDAAPDHPMDLMRMKHAAELMLKSSGLAWTIVRPTAFMETWCEVLCRPLLEKGRAVVFGRGRNPINWVSVMDVARFVELAILDPALRGRTIEVGGPENLTMTEFIRVFQSETGSVGRVGHVPLTAMRVGAGVMRLVNPALARQMQAGVIMDTRPQAFSGQAPGLDHATASLTSLAEVVRRDFVVPRRE